MHGTATSAPEVTNISSHGLRIIVDERELFLSYEDFRWFKDATVRQIIAVERPRERHLRWPELDVDLTIESIEHPERYPLKWRENA